MKYLQILLTILYTILFMSLLYSVSFIDGREVLECALSLIFLLFITITNYVEIPLLVKSGNLDISLSQRRNVKIANLLSLLTVVLYIPLFTLGYVFEHPVFSKILSSINLLLMLYVILLKYKTLKSHYWHPASK